MVAESNILSLDGEFSLGERAFAAIVADMRQIAPRRIVEFGSGSSSIRLAMAFPQSHVLSIDHSTEFRDITIGRMVSAGVAPENLTLELRPIRWQRFGVYGYRSYEVGRFEADVDAVLVDGPPGWIARGREACLHQVARMLRVGGRVYLDDVKRRGEARVSRNWLRTYPELKRVAELSVDHGVDVFQVMLPLSGPRFSIGVVVDNLSVRCWRVGSSAVSMLRDPLMFRR